MAYNNYDPSSFDIDKLKQDQQDAKDTKNSYNALGSVLQGFANIQSPYELLYNKKVQHADPQGVMKTLADNVEDPVKKNAALAQAYMQAKNAKKLDFDVQNSQIANQDLQESHDVNSTKNQVYRSGLKRDFPQLAQSMGPMFDQLTVNDEKNIFEPLKLKETIDARKAQTALAKGKQADDKYDKYLTHVEDAERSWRSDPASTRFDGMIAASTSGKAMIDRYRGHEDDMPIADVHALVSDRLKAITGVAPTEKEIEAQMPHNKNTTWAGIKSYFTGNPEPANQGEFVRNIDSGFKEMEQTAMKGLQNRQNTVASNPKLKPEDRDRLVKIGMPLPSYTHDQNVSQQLPEKNKNIFLPEAEASKKPVQKFVNEKLNKTMIIYSDGTKEVLDGRQ